MAHHATVTGEPYKCSYCKAPVCSKPFWIEVLSEIAWVCVNCKRERDVRIAQGAKRPPMIALTPEEILVLEIMDR